ncbi:HlyD family secretion protein [Natronogracilivirga saccharolytica]|uniref:Biotin/lipoyl-binding protein n=1 Tax=Natronogracilivirga saccharolytica TaxID=2812953 RepID=A0A8J7UW54_9BACT|nr:biotin/lipoyl-binding protein [Natronogracilivirga saccharolytica]
MNRKKIIIAILAVVIIVSGVSLAVMAGRQYEKDREGPLEGKVKLESVYLAPKVPGRIESVAVREGEQVDEGDTLLIIDVPEIEARLDQARGALSSARAQYQKAKSGATEFDRRRVQAKVDAAESQYSFAKASYRRMENMFNDSLIAAQEYDKIRSKYESARSQLEAAEAKKEDVDTGVRSEKIEMARGDYERAKAAFREAETAYDDRVITAPKPMRIQSVMLQRGELATPGYNLFSGYDTESTKIRFTVPESKMNEFEVGQTHSMEAPFDSRTFRVTLDRIQPLPDYASITSMYPRHELGETVYELYFRPVPGESTGELHHNMTFLLKGAGE